jgi:N-acetylmuramoyl-L-alanine amidase
VTSTAAADFRADSPVAKFVYPALNVEPRRGDGRVSLLILHYTGMSCATKAIDWLSREESRVSCHYVVDDLGAVTQMVPEHLRAWHAGISYWHGETDINSASIGIEIHNPGHADGYPDFTEPQMQSVLALCQDIVARNGIRPENVLAHSDVAPERKIDPGEKFNWRLLAENGVGFYVEPAAVWPTDDGLGIGDHGERVAKAQNLLRELGFNAADHGMLDEPTSKMLRAFQLRHRRARIDGRLDRSTELTLWRVLNHISGGFDEGVA